MNKQPSVSEAQTHAAGCITSTVFHLPEILSGLSGIPEKVMMQCRIVASLICSHTVDSHGACYGGRGEGEGLKCSARYSKRCLINNVSERAR